MITKNKKFPFLLMMGILILVFAFGLTARENPEFRANYSGLTKVAAQDKYARTLCNISNFSYWLYYDGKSAIDPNGNSGGVYPRGTAGTIFTDGIIWGGYAQDGDSLKVGGQTYNIGTSPGWIVTPGVKNPDGSVTKPVAASAEDNPRVRMYRVRQDWRGLRTEDDEGNIILDVSVLQDAAEVNFVSLDEVTDDMQNAVVDQYGTDWKEWPTDVGAPYYDEDGDGEYNPVLDASGYPIIGVDNDGDNQVDEYYDRPGLAGGDQVVWFAVNDLSASRTLNLYGTMPIGIELQITVWAYNQPGATLGQTVFKKFKIINKSGQNIDSMFVAQWSDPDIGVYTDDLAGCDVDLGLGFGYSGYRTDGNYDPFGLPPAAVGYDFFQGPMVDGVEGQDLNRNGVDDAVDYAVFDLKVVGPGKINLPMTSFLYFAAGSAISDPDLGEGSSALEWYNMLNGYIPTEDLENPSPYTIGNIPVEAGGQPTKFPLSGDPFTGAGDIDGVGLQLPPGDRRIGLSSGPFWMTPMDTQEVVIAVVGGIISQPGGDNRNAVAQMKMNDAYAQFLYDNLFEGVPTPPVAPLVTVTEYENQISLEWGTNWDRVTATERDDPILGFDFEGYTVYQMPNPNSTKDQATVVATFDKTTFPAIIRQNKFLPAFGDIVAVPVQYGKDEGVQRHITLERDYINNLPLYNGKTYYFAVTAYNFNPGDVPEPSLESALTAIPVIPQYDNPGYALGSDPEDIIADEENNHSAGAAEQLTMEVTVIDPLKLTGDDYLVYFENWHFYMDMDGQWKRTNYPDSVGKALAKPGDLTGTTLSAIAYTSPNVGTRDLRFILDLVSPDYDYSDGVSLTFPSEITINSAEDAIGNTYGSGYHPVIDQTTNTVLWGSPDTTGDGDFSGGEVFTVNVNTPELPLDVDYIVWDDGWAVSYGSPYDTLGDGVVHAVGTCTITEEGFAFKTVPMWGLENTTKEEIKLEGQDKLYNEPHEQVGAPIVDGFKISVGGSYEAPTDFFDVIWVNTAGEEESVTNFDQSQVSSYGYSGWEDDARATTTRGQGTSDLTILIKDYELRWTGVFEPETVGGQVIMNVSEGTGSMARLYEARSDDLDLHPMNPNPGTTEDPFMIRIPFEVWNVDDNQQVNFDLVDRMQTFSTSDTVWAFNPRDRMYCEIVNTPYKETLYTEEDLDQMTWNLVFWEAPYVEGDVLKIIYPNPILLGVDELTFSTAGLGQSFSTTKEAQDVGNISVFPNPYYAFHGSESNRFDRYVTFNHLPEKVTIRIFDLSSVQVRKFTEQDKQGDVNSEFLRWDLRNESDIPVASGIYIVLIDMPELGKVKVLKVFIIQSQEMLKYY